MRSIAETVLLDVWSLTVTESFPATIEIESVSKAFGKRPAVIDLSLRVPAGGIYGLLGHNGAGKSTTLGMLLGQVYPDAGQVRLHGHDVFRDRRAALTQVGAIFESPCFYDYLSGRRNLQVFTGYTQRVNPQRLNEVIELVGLDGRIDDKVGMYSHGMRQRLALAQALLPGPKTLILDEPTDGLDPEGIAEFRRTIQRLNQELGLTILFSSHLLSEVQQLCDRVAVLNRGRRVFEGAWDQADTGPRMLELETDRNEDAIQQLVEAGLILRREPTSIPSSSLPLADDTEPAEVNRFLVERGFRVSRLALTKLSLEAFYMRMVEQIDATDVDDTSGDVEPRKAATC